MNSIRNTKSKTILILLTIALFFCANVGLISLFLNETYASTVSDFYNGNFNNNTSSEMPFNPNNWTASGSTDNLSVKAGVISTDTTKYNNNKNALGLSTLENPGKTGTDDYILMLNSTGASFGYTSDSFVIKKGENYRVSISVWSNGYVASMYLSSNEDSTINSAKLESINTSNTWTTYNFYITGYDYKNISVSLNIWIGKKPSISVSGIAFYDNISVTNISNTNLRSAVTSGSTHAGETYYYTNLNEENRLQSYNFASTPFTLDSSSASTATDLDYVSYLYANMTGATVSFPDGTIKSSAGTDLSYGNTTSLAILNKQSSYISFASSEYNLLPNRVYKFTVRLKIVDISGTAFVKLKDMSENGTDKTLTISSTSTNDTTNDYVDVSIYVRSHAIDTKPVKMFIGLGSDTSGATGEVYFTNYTISVVPYSTFSGLSTSSLNGSLDLTSDAVSGHFSNPLFNEMTYEGIDQKVYPSTPTSWTGTNNTSASGVVNTNYFSEYTSNVTAITQIAAQNPGVINNYNTTLNNNVLALYNNYNTGIQKYTSDEVTLTKSTYNKISVCVQTQIISNTGAASVVIKSGNTVIAKKSDIVTGGTWQQLDFYIHTGLKDLAVKIELCLGNGDDAPVGYAFYDNTLLNYLTQPTSFEGISANDYCVLVDLDDSFQKGEIDGNYYTHNLYTGTVVAGSSSVTSGIVDLTESTTFLPNGINLSSVEQDKLLSIFCTYDTAYNVSSNWGYALTSGNYYKLTVKILTYNLAQTQDSQVTDDDDNVYPYGVNLSLSTFTDTFSAINNQNIWKEYAFYINPDSDTTPILTLSLGSSNAKTSGMVFMTNPVIETFDSEDDFESDMVTFKQVNTVNNVLSVTEPIVDEDDDDTTDNEDENNINWVVIPSLITALAVIIAVAGTMIRKVKFNKTKKVKATEYDRQKTVVRQMYRRQAIEQRDAKIKSLDKQKTDLLSEKEKNDSDYKNNLMTMRSLKMKRDTSLKNEISKYEKLLRQQTKAMSQIGVKLNAIESEIAYLKTETYLSQLQIQLSQTKKITETEYKQAEKEYDQTQKSKTDEPETEDK